jgi:hypothetical protein
MAKVEENLATLGLRGRVGNLVFRRRGNKTTVYVLPTRKAGFSEKQKQAQQDFAEAVARAKHALSNESERRQFEELAKNRGKESAYSAAVSCYFKQIHRNEAF